MEFLRTFAIKRGWSSANGLPDETRAGRTILKDYTAGKLVSAEMPPGFEPKNRAAMVGEQVRLLDEKYCFACTECKASPSQLTSLIQSKSLYHCY